MREGTGLLHLPAPPRGHRVPQRRLQWSRHLPAGIPGYAGVSLGRRLVSHKGPAGRWHAAQKPGVAARLPLAMQLWECTAVHAWALR